MKKDSKQRLFEVMSRLDGTFKPRLNEGFEEIEATDVAVPAQTGDEFPEKELSIEEKYEELKNKVEELYAMIHGEESEESEESEEGSEEEMNERKKWNFEKKKGEKESDDDEDDESKEHEKSETPAEEKAEHKVDETNTKKIPVAAIAKVGK
jgi:hypothetical protein